MKPYMTSIPALAFCAGVGFGVAFASSISLAFMAYDTLKERRRG